MGTQNCPGPQRLAWEAVSGATEYAIRIDRDKNNGNPCTGTPGDRCEENIRATHYDGFSFEAGHEYSWWVHARNSCGQLGQTEGNPLSILNPADAPTNLGPSGAIAPGARDIIWAPPPHGYVAPPGFAIRIEDNNNSGSHAQVCDKPEGQDHQGDECFNGNGTAWSYNFQEGHTYGIWVHAFSCGGILSQQTSVSVQVQSSQPPPPQEQPQAPPSAACERKRDGDADCNGQIDLKDFEIWRNKFSGGAVAQGEDPDFDGGGVTIADFEIWRSHAQ